MITILVGGLITTNTPICAVAKLPSWGESGWLTLDSVNGFYCFAFFFMGGHFSKLTKVVKKFGSLTIFLLLISLKEGFAVNILE